MPRHSRAAAFAVAALLALGVLSGCGDSEDPEAASSSSSGSSDVVDSTPDAEAVGIDAAFAGVLGTPPTEPTKPPAGAKVWVVSCGEAVPTCATPTAGAVAAAEAAGMEATACDGKLNPQGWAECIRQGISAQVDGIIVIGQDCASIQGALQEAKSADIPTVGDGGNDCDISGGDKLFSAIVQDLPNMTAQQFWERTGALQAAWIIGKTDGKANVLSLKFTDAIWGGWIQDGFEAELATCDGCTVEETLELGNQDVGSGQLPQKVSTALLKYPSANAINVPLDGWFFAGLAQAIQSSGRSDDLNVIGNFGEIGNLDFIRNNGGEDATVGFNADWGGWAGVDTLIRVLNGDEVLPAGIGLQVVDADTNMPAEGQPFAYNPPIDFASAYQQLWNGA